jgi:hypothetical protein
MPQLVEFTLLESTPNLKALLRREVNGRTVPARLATLFGQALEVFERLAAPRALIKDVPAEHFSEIYRGEGLNAAESPLAEIYPKAQRLAVFAATLGDAASDEIGILFKRGEPALGYALDVIASESVSLLAERLGQRMLASLRDRHAASEDSRVLPYSPGYCGWHISGQRRLLDVLHAGTIGMALSNTFLMRPMKSVSGVLVAGSAATHRFRPVYPFCEDCTTHECRPRMASVLKAVHP